MGYKLLWIIYIYNIYNIYIYIYNIYIYIYYIYIYIIYIYVYIVDEDKEDVLRDENVVDLFIQDSNTIV